MVHEYDFMDSLVEGNSCFIFIFSLTSKHWFIIFTSIGVIHIFLFYKRREFHIQKHDFDGQCHQLLESGKTFLLCLSFVFHYFFFAILSFDFGFRFDYSVIL